MRPVAPVRMRCMARLGFTMSLKRDQAVLLDMADSEKAR